MAFHQTLPAIFNKCSWASGPEDGLTLEGKRDGIGEELPFKD